MNQLKTSLSTVAAMAAMLGVVACGSSNKQANSPNSAQTSPQQSGAAMGQPGNAGETGTENNAQGGAMNPSAEPQQGTGQGGSQSTGSTGMGPEGRNTNSESTSPHTIGEGSSANSPMNSPSTGVTAAQAGANDTSSLTDGQVAGVMQAINQAQIQQALLAQSKASTPEVKRFARQMVTTYRAVQTKESALFSRLQISPSESTISNDIRANAQNDLSTLQSSKGKDFDKSYIDAEVKHLQDVSDILDRATRDSRSSELKTEIQNMRTKADGHLRDAQRIQQNLESGKTTP